MKPSIISFQPQIMKLSQYRYLFSNLFRCLVLYIAFQLLSHAINVLFMYFNSALLHDDETLLNSYYQLPFSFYLFILSIVDGDDCIVKKKVYS